MNEERLLEYYHSEWIEVADWPIEGTDLKTRNRYECAKIGHLTESYFHDG